MRGELLDAEVGAAPLAEVLGAVAEQAGFVIETRGDLGKVRPQAFAGVPLHEAIRRLIGDNRVNLVTRYEVGPDGQRRLAEVRAQAAGEVPPEVMEQERMRILLSGVRPPPPPPPPPLDFEPN